MPIYYNGKKIKNVYYGGRKIKEAWYGGRKVYTAVVVPTWVPEQHYTVGQQVEFNGVTYECIRDHNSYPYAAEPGSGKWWTEYWKIV